MFGITVHSYSLSSLTAARGVVMAAVSQSSLHLLPQQPLPYPGTGSVWSGAM